MVRLFELDGVFGIAALGARKGDELGLTRAYTKLGEALGIDWAQQQQSRASSRRPVGAAAHRRPRARFRAAAHRLPRTASAADDPDKASTQWVEAQGPRIEQFRRLIERARNAAGHHRADARPDRHPGAGTARLPDRAGEVGRVARFDPLRIDPRDQGVERQAAGPRLRVRLEPRRVARKRLARTPAPG
jgi:hypothetical protein